jgi:hypothetical protein
MDIQELTAEYGHKSDEDLLRLALNTETLTPDALFVLSSELTRRGLNSPECLGAARREEAARKAEIERDPGKQFLVPLWGVGRMRFGKADKVYDPNTGLERFKTTVFIVLLWLPLIPTGTYLIERDRKLPDDLHPLEKLPLDWEQVLKVWVVAATSLLALVWLAKLLPRLLF